MPPRGPGFDEMGDATRRTSLAAERTVLAWLRTGLTVLAVALAIGRILPELRDGEDAWGYKLLGGAYGVLGIAIIAYGLARGRTVDRALRAGRWAPLDDRAMWAFGLATGALGVATVVLILVA